jgi:type II secretory pathway pseudopilin PulG
MNKSKLKFRGETLVEVLVAIGILGVVLITSFVLVNRGIGTNVTVKNKIIAINIAREGIEGIRNIRDTNWLKYSGDRRNKWLWDKTNDDTISDGYYIIDFENSEFILEKDSVIQHKLDLINTSNDYENYCLYKDASTSRYTHNNDPGASQKTIFYRQLILKAEKPEECDAIGSDNYTCTSNSRLHVISRVQWREPLLAGDETASTSDLIGTVVMETYLYDYLGRDGY